MKVEITTVSDGIITITVNKVVSRSSVSAANYFATFVRGFVVLRDKADKTYRLYGSKSDFFMDGVQVAQTTYDTILTLNRKFGNAGGGDTGGGAGSTFSTTATLSTTKGDSNTVALSTLTPSDTLPKVGSWIFDAAGTTARVTAVDDTNATAVTDIDVATDADLAAAVTAHNTDANAHTSMRAFSASLPNYLGALIDSHFVFAVGTQVYLSAPGANDVCTITFLGGSTTITLTVQTGTITLHANGSDFELYSAANGWHFGATLTPQIHYSEPVGVIPATVALLPTVTVQFTTAVTGTNTCAYQKENNGTQSGQVSADQAVTLSKAMQVIQDSQADPEQDKVIRNGLAQNPSAYQTESRATFDNSTTFVKLPKGTKLYLRKGALGTDLSVLSGAPMMGIRVAPDASSDEPFLFVANGTSYVGATFPYVQLEMDYNNSSVYLCDNSTFIPSATYTDPATGTIASYVNDGTNDPYITFSADVWYSGVESTPDEGIKDAAFFYTLIPAKAGVVPAEKATQLDSAIANRCEVQTGTFTIPAVPAVSGNAVTVTFAKAFTAAPTVLVQWQAGGTGWATVRLEVASASTTNFTVNTWNFDSTAASTAGTVHYIAVNPLS
jgi:hypothetical protein